MKTVEKPLIKRLFLESENGAVVYRINIAILAESNPNNQIPTFPSK